MKVEFADDAPMNKDNANKLARFVKGYCEHEHLPPLDNTAMAKIVEYASKLADDQTKLSTRFTDLSQIVAEAATWAKLSRAKIITGEFITKALTEKTNRVRKYDEKYVEMIKEHTLLIDTTGEKVGQINGLTIMNVGDYTFGKPVKITANTYTGKNGVINIEREVELSGSTHSKGILILSAYIGEMFAQDIPLSLTASICFEQLYNGVDGDSASSTELYAILSSLSGIPINQSLAVTGSVNQKGEIQPIGGANDKIEGFYQICKMRGLDGSHGVIIPRQNVHNLNLSTEVVESVKNKFNKTYDIAIDFYGYGSFTTAFLARKIKAKKKATWLHDEKIYWLKSVENYLPIYDKIFGVSQAVMDAFCREYPTFKEKAAVFYNVINTNDIKHKAEENVDIQFNKDKFNILTVGRLTEQKGYDIAIFTASILAKRGINFTWYVIGSGRDEKKLRKLAYKTYHLEKQFVFLGQKKNPYPYMKKCDLYVQPSRHEGYGITLMEARTLCRAILASDIPVFREQIVDGMNGYLTELNSNSLADKIEYLYKNPVERKKTIEYLQNNPIDFSPELKKLETI